MYPPITILSPAALKSASQAAMDWSGKVKCSEHWFDKEHSNENDFHGCFNLPKYFNPTGG